MVKEITFIGAQKVAADELKAVMVTKEGGYFSFLTGEGTYREEAFQRDLAVIQAAYYDRGFINVEVDKPAVSLSPDKRYIYITIKVDEGEPYDIGKIDFGGDLLVAQGGAARADDVHAGRALQPLQALAGHPDDHGRLLRPGLRLREHQPRHRGERGQARRWT